MADIREISPELTTKARIELHEVVSRIPEDIAALRGWVKKQPHLKARTDDQFMLTFLRGAKYSLEKAKEKIDFYYTIKSLSPELFLHKQVDDEAIALARLGTFVPLPKPLKKDGPRLHITRYGHVNPNDHKIVDIFKHQMRVFEIEMREDDNSIIGGMINIVDMAAMSLGYMLQFDPVLVKKLGVFADKAIPFRIKGVHLINVPKQAATIINISRSLMAKKVKDRMIIHTSLETLYEHVPKEYLPEEYGGENGRLQDTVMDWVKRIEEYKDYFNEDLQYGADEHLRVGTKVSSEILFGLDGSFRKLEVD